MAVNPRRVTARVVERIRRSEHSLRVVFPVLKAKPTGTSPIAMPISPLMPKPNPQPVSDEDPERVQSDAVVKCLYLESAVMADVRNPRLEATLGGWNREIRGYARVIASDIEKPGGGTILDGCDYVEVAGGRYQVMSIVKATASMVKTGTYYVVLTGAAKS